MAFWLQVICFFVAYPIFCLYQLHEKKQHKEMLQRKIDEAAVKGNHEEAAFYIERLVRYK